MTIAELLLDPGLYPFIVAIGVVAAMLVLELLLNQIGASLMGDPDADLDLGNEPDVDFDVDLAGEADVDLELEAEFDADVDTDVELGDAEAPETTASGGLLSWMGFGSVPFSVWLAGMLTAFGLCGYILQLGAAWTLGRPLSALSAAVLVLPVAAALGARVARGIGALLPKSESSAISRRSYGKRRGVITVGTASADRPAQARFTDGHGNMHFAMVVPFDRNEELPQGTEVLIVRGRDGTLKALRV